MLTYKEHFHNVTYKPSSHWGSGSWQLFIYRLFAVTVNELRSSKKNRDLNMNVSVHIGNTIDTVVLWDVWYSVFLQKTFAHLKFCKNLVEPFWTWNQTMKWYKSHKKCPSKHFFLLKRPKIMAVLQMCAKMQFWHWTLLPIITVFIMTLHNDANVFLKSVLTYFQS